MFAKLVAVLAIVAVPSIVLVKAQDKKPSAEVKAYLDYRKEVQKAKRIEDIYFYLDRQTTEYYKALGQAERTKIFQQLKSQVELFPEAQAVKEEHTAAGATVVFEALSGDKTQKATVTVELLREGAALKVGPATWK